MNRIAKPAQNTHNLHNLSAKADSAPPLPVRDATADSGLKLVGVVGIGIPLDIENRQVIEKLKRSKR